MKSVYKYLFVSAAGLAVLVACSSEDPETGNVGYVEADWLYISSPQAGWLTDGPAPEGHNIQTGDLLFRLDTSQQEAAIAEADARLAQLKAEARNTQSGARPAEIRRLQAELAQTKAHLVQAEAERERILPLVELGIEPRNRGEQVEANYQSAVAAVSAATESITLAQLPARSALREASDAAAQAAFAARASAAIQLEERSVHSMVSGRVEEVFHKTGEFVAAGTPIVALLPTDGLKVRFFATQEDLAGLDIGRAVSVSADGLAAPVQARISYIATDAEFTPPVIYSKDARGKLVFLIEASLPQAEPLRPGLPVDVSW